MRVKFFTRVTAFSRDLVALEDQVNEFIAQVEAEGGEVLDVKLHNQGRNDSRQDKTWILWSVTVLFNPPKERRDET